MRLSFVFSGIVLSLAIITGMNNAFAQKKQRPMMRCEDHFKSTDTDKDGKVTLEEFSAIKHPRGNAKDLFKSRDVNNDGFLTVDEFCERGMMHGHHMMGNCEDHFKSMDTDKDGKVSLAEFKSARHPHGNPDNMFKIRDADKDGFLTMDEFCKKGMKPGKGRK